MEKVEKLAANLNDKTEYAMHLRNLKQSLNHGLVLKKVQKFIYIYRKIYRKEELLYTELYTERRNYLVSKQNYHTTKFFTENLLAIEMKTKQKYL